MSNPNVEKLKALKLTIDKIDKLLDELSKEV